MIKYFDINKENCSIHCDLYYNEQEVVNRVIVYGHGFCGHKDNRASEKFAKHILSKYKDIGVVTFNLPCHGDDIRKNLLLNDCDLYIKLVAEYVRETYKTDVLYVYATSFGGYLFLKYIAEHGNPFQKCVFRCPAVNMFEVLTNSVMSEGEYEAVIRGKPALVGFDRKIKVTGSFLEDLKKADLFLYDFTPYHEDILIMHGTKDEIVPFEKSKMFAEKNKIDFVPVEDADHRFVDSKKMNLATEYTTLFFEL